MGKLVIDGYKGLSPADLIRFNGSKFYLDSFKSKDIRQKEEEVKSNKVYLALYKALTETNSYAVGLGNISRSKEIWLEFNGIPIKLLKSTATDADTTPVGNMSLCCNADVGQKKFCKSCGDDVDEVGKQIKIAKDLTIPIPKEQLEEIRAIRQKPYAIFADEKGLCLSELYYSEKIRVHNVNTDGYMVGEQDIDMVKHAIAPVEFEVETLTKDFNMSEMFGSKPKTVV
jgi:hypothetical protein